MPYKDLEPVSKQLTIVVGLTVVGFMAFGLALSFYRNVLFEQTLQNIAEQNGGLKGRIEQSKRDLEYYGSAQYKDKYAKENLGKISPGENVLIISNTQTPSDILVAEADERMSEIRETAYLELLRQMPALEHWNIYFFHKEKIEELKNGAVSK